MRQRIVVAERFLRQNQFRSKVHRADKFMFYDGLNDGVSHKRRQEMRVHCLESEDIQLL